MRAWPAALYAGFVRFLGPDLAGVEHTFDMTMYMLVGGIGTLLGPLLGAVAVPWLTQYLQFLQEYRFVVFGPMLIAAGDLPAGRHRRHLARLAGARAPRPARGRAGGRARHAGRAPPTARRRAMLEIRNLTKRFGGLAAVDDVTHPHRGAARSTPSSAPTAPARPPSST